MTAALNRATDALAADERDRLGADKHAPESYWPRLASTALSAALTDPDDPDWLAIELHYAGQDLVEVDGEWTHLDWTALTGSERQALRRQAARLKAAILGGAS